MVKQIEGKLNSLELLLEGGLLVDSHLLRDKGYSTSLVSHYVSTGRIEQVTRGVYRRKLGQAEWQQEIGKLTWQQAVVSLQTVLLRDPLYVGGLSALELQGFAHFVQQGATTVHLYGPKPPPTWLHKLPLEAKFKYHNDRTLFGNEPIHHGLTSQSWKDDPNKGFIKTDEDHHFRSPAGPRGWPLTLSTPERAVLELLDEIPDDESFHHVDKIFEGLSTLVPRRLDKLLKDCTSIKVKRLFLFFASKHQHAWAKQLKPQDYGLGTGNRVIAKGGRLDKQFKITVPSDL
ncbi:MAG: hypothetical protein RL495_1136 [Verrucomicrobiota bacterium]|jgi:hypothetical protein